MKDFSTLNSSNSTIVNVAGKEYRTVEDPSLQHKQGLYNVEENHYAAVAVDQENEEYIIYWNPVEGFEEIEDESETCDWEHPAYVQKI